MSDFQPYVKDIRWLFVHCKQAGIKPPDGAHCEAFSERVSIMMADAGMTESDARDEAFKDQFWHVRLAGIDRQPADTGKPWRTDTGKAMPLTL